MRPSRVDTSDPAWVKRKMLSMNSNTSWFCTSRKYSAIVSAESATRSRVPGGSSIWPKTRAVWPMTPASVISAIRSLPSRVRSPTPANTETPPWSFATRAIISWISTVLPTPAPPKRPILPPCTYGVRRSMTLMPVWNISVLASSWSNAGALRWMPHRSSTLRVSPSCRLRTSPVALKTCPLVASPTGTLIGPPVSVTSAPRTRPSVGRMEMARTMPSPMCSETSSVMVVVTSPRVRSTFSALYISGIESSGNSTSTTGPITRATRPTAPPLCSDRVSLIVAVISLTHSLVGGSFAGGVRIGERVHAADDLADLLGDAGLAGLVGDPGVLLDQLLGVVRGGLHRLLPSRQLGGRGLQQREVDAALDVLREQGVEHLLRVRLELEERQHLVGRRLLLALDHLERQQPDVRRLLHQHAAEAGEHDVDLVDRGHLGTVGALDAFLGVGSGDEGGDERLADLAGDVVGRLVGVSAPGLHHVTAAEREVRDALAPGDVDVDLLALPAQLLREALGLLDRAGGVGARQATVAGDHQDHGAPALLG